MCECVCVCMGQRQSKGHKQQTGEVWESWPAVADYHDGTEKKRRLGEADEQEAPGDISRLIRHAHTLSEGAGRGQAEYGFTSDT